MSKFESLEKVSFVFPAVHVFYLSIFLYAVCRLEFAFKSNIFNLILLSISSLFVFSFTMASFSDPILTFKLFWMAFFNSFYFLLAQIKLLYYLRLFIFTYLMSIYIHKLEMTHKECEFKDDKEIQIIKSSSVFTFSMTHRNYK